MILSKLIYGMVKRGETHTVAFKSLLRALGVTRVVKAYREGERLTKDRLEREALTLEKVVIVSGAADLC